MTTTGRPETGHRTGGPVGPVGPAGPVTAATADRAPGRFARGVRAEIRKLTSTRLAWVLLLATAALVAVNVGATMAVSTTESLRRQSGGIDVQTAGGVRTVLALAAGGNQLAVVLGIVLVTTEFRHRTISETFLLEPDRFRVVFAKLSAALVAGAVFGAASVVAAFSVALPWLAARGIPVPAGDAAGAALGSFVAVTLWCALGVGIGSLITHQVGAIVTGLLGVSIVSGILFSVVPAVGRYLPEAAGAALAGSSSGHTLPAWAGGLILAAYVASTAAAGAFAMSRRDIS